MVKNICRFIRYSNNDIKYLSFEKYSISSISPFSFRWN